MTIFQDWSKYNMGFDCILNGTEVIIDNNITKRIRCRKHKKKRIDKKWEKNYGYKEVQDDTKIYMFEGKLLMSQKCFDRLKKILN